MKATSNTRPASSPTSGNSYGTAATVPRTVGNWEILGLLGEGMWSGVYRARPLDSPADRPADYAVKVAKTTCQPPGFSSTLLGREAEVGRSVAHRHLIAVLAADLDDPSPHLVTPLVHGVPLNRTLQVQGRLSTAFALWIARQVSEAVSSLHAAGWMHADVKPSNIIVSAQGHATLLDLGFALRLDTSECATTSAIRGTPSHTAPEMFSSAIPVDGRCDIYSLGVTLYQMLTGRLPFTDGDLVRLAAAHLRHRIPNPRRFVPSLNPDVAQLVRSMLAKEPLRRPTAGELVDWLADLEIATLEERRA